MKKGDLTVTIFCYILGSLVLLGSWGFPSLINNVPGPGVFPSIISGVLIIAGTLLLLQNLKGRTPTKSSTMPVGPRLYFFAGVFLYVFFVGLLGFISSTVFFLFLMIKNLGKNSYKYSIIYSILIAICVYSIFNFLLNVPLNFGFLF